MSLVILILIGIAVWWIIDEDNQKSKQTSHPRQNAADKEFEEVNLASKDDDFGIF